MSLGYPIGIRIRSNSLFVKASASGGHSILEGKTHAPPLDPAAHRSRGHISVYPPPPDPFPQRTEAGSPVRPMLGERERDLQEPGERRPPRGGETNGRGLVPPRSGRSPLMKLAKGPVGLQLPNTIAP